MYTVIHTRSRASVPLALALLIGTAAVVTVGTPDRSASAMPPVVWFVDIDASGTESGADWVNAFSDFDDAVASAMDGDEIWVSEGTYADPDDLVQDIEVFGGFDGPSTPNFNDRDPSGNPTIFTGGIRLGGTVAVPGTTIGVDGVQFRAVNADGFNVYVLNDTIVSLIDVVINGGSNGLVVQQAEVDLLDVSIIGVNDTFPEGKAVALSGSDLRGRNVSINGNSFGLTLDASSGAGSIKLVDSSVISNGTGISSSTSGPIELIGTEISGNAFGLSVLAHSGSPLVTIDRSTFKFAFDTGLRLGDSANVTVTNSIITDSIGPEIEVVADTSTDVGSAQIQGTTVSTTFTTSDEIVDPGGMLAFSNSIIDLAVLPAGPLGSTFGFSLVRGSGGSGPGWSFGGAVDNGFNLDRDPRFVSGTDFELDPFSPAIDAGLAPSVGGSGQDVDGDPRPIDLKGDMGAQEGDRARLNFLTPSCLAYDSTSASGPLAGAIDGGEVRTIDLTGALSGQGGATNCLPTSAVAAVVSIQVINPQTFGNLRLSEAGIVPTGGVVNFAVNGLANSNTVSVPLSSDGEIDVGANGAPGDVGLPSTDVRVRILGWYDGSGQLVYHPGTPCAVHDSRVSEGGSGGWAGPFGPGSGPDSIGLSDPIPTGQGGTTGTCNIGPTFYVMNLVAVGSSGGSGYLTLEAGTNPAPIVAFADIGMSNAAVALHIPASASIYVHGDLAATTETRAVLLGHYGGATLTDGSDYTPINPCAAFDSRSGQGAAGAFVGPFDGAETVTYTVAGESIPADQGGLNGGTCGVPDGAAGVLVNLVATNAESFGNLQAYASGATPTGGVLNFAPLSPAMNNSNAVPVQLSAGGQIDVTVNGGPFGVGTPQTNVRGVILGYFD